MKFTLETKWQIERQKQKEGFSIKKWLKKEGFSIKGENKMIKTFKDFKDEVDEATIKPNGVVILESYYRGQRYEIKYLHPCGCVAFYGCVSYGCASSQGSWDYCNKHNPIWDEQIDEPTEPSQEEKK